MWGAIATGVGAVWRIGKGVWNIRGLIKEIKDVVELAQKLWDKYDDLDDDAKQMVKELNDVIGKVKSILSIK